MMATGLGPHWIEDEPGKSKPLMPLPEMLEPELWNDYRRAI